MSIADLIPWKQKKKRVSVKVREHTVHVLDQEGEHRSPALSRWVGLAPFGDFGGWSDFLGPRMDLGEFDDRFTVAFEVPGMNENEIQVTVSGDRLTVRGQTQVEREHRGLLSHRLYRAKRGPSS